MEKLKAIDAEYYIYPIDDNSMIIGVRSKSLNANVPLKINDKYLSESTVKSLMQDLYNMEHCLVGQRTKQKKENDNDSQI